MKNRYKKVYSLSHQAGYRNYTVKDLLELKGRKKMTQINVISPEEASAAEDAGIDMIITGTNRLKEIREAAPNTFLTCGPNYTGHETKEKMMKEVFELVRIGVDSIHTNSWNINFIKYLSEFKIPFQGHVGLVPMKSTWTGGVKPVGKKSSEAIKIYNDIKNLEEIGAWAVEVECVPEDVLGEITKKTDILTISIGSGKHGDIQFLFGEDILGYNLSSAKTPRHAKKYNNFNKVYEKLQKERIQAFKEYQNDVQNKKFPSKNNIVLAEKTELEKFRKLIKKIHHD